jgi:hypothetical protein
MDIRIGDELIMKKKHPCGSNRFEVTRIGADLRIKCLGCGREILQERIKIEKNIRKVMRDGDAG